MKKLIFRLLNFFLIRNKILYCFNESKEYFVDSKGNLIQEDYFTKNLFKKRNKIKYYLSNGERVIEIWDDLTKTTIQEWYSKKGLLKSKIIYNRWGDPLRIFYMDKEGNLYSELTKDIEKYY